MGRRKRVQACKVIIYCGACQSKCILDLDKNSPSKAELYQAQYDTFYVCADCTPEIERLEEEEDLYYFQSHLVESVVNYSSHP